MGRGCYKILGGFYNILNLVGAVLASALVGLQATRAEASTAPYEIQISSSGTRFRSRIRLKWLGVRPVTFLNWLERWATLL